MTHRTARRSDRPAGVGGRGGGRVADDTAAIVACVVAMVTGMPDGPEVVPPLILFLWPLGASHQSGADICGIFTFLDF